MLGFRTSFNKGVEQEPGEFRARPHLGPPSPLELWRTCEPYLLSSGDVSRLRKALVGTSLPSEPDWKRAVLGNVAVGIAVRQLKVSQDYGSGDRSRARRGPSLRDRGRRRGCCFPVFGPPAAI
jgi:hypothetical protein